MSLSRVFSRPARGQRGVSLVESLVALLVLSVGMLGIAALFLESVRSSRTALLRTQAVNLVTDMADRIRANAIAGDAYDLDRYGGGPGSRNCAATIAGPGGNCTPAQLAEDDLARWVEAVRAALPTLDGVAPVAEVAFTAGAGGQPNRYLIEVQWREPGEPAPYRFRSEILVLPRVAT